MTIEAAAKWLGDQEKSVAPFAVFDGHELAGLNAAACRELRREAGEVVGSGFSDELTPDSLERLATGLASADEAPVVVVRRRGRGPAGMDDVFDLRLQRVDTEVVAALIIDSTEEHRLDGTIAALAESTTALDDQGRMAWRPFGNSGRFGVPDEEAIGVLVLEWVHPDELPHLLQLFNEIKAEPDKRLTELIRLRHPYIRDGWVKTRITGVNKLDDPLLRAVIVRSEEMTPIDLVEDIGQTAGQYVSIAEAMPVGVVVTDAGGTVVYRNELARSLLGLGDIIGRTDWLADVTSDMTEELEQLLAKSRQDRCADTIIAAFQKPDGKPLWLRVDAVPQVDEAGNVFGLIATLLDVTSETTARGELAEAQTRLWHLATHDPLTNLPNRVLILDRLETALKRSTSASGGVALLYCDLDGFKPVNDSYGHAVGDEVLQVTARRLAELVRENDVVGRFGGDEFLVLCEGFDSRSEVEGLVQRLVAGVAEPIEVDGTKISVGVTVGIAYASGSTRVDDLITRADDSMYAGKAARDESLPERRRR